MHTGEILEADELPLRYVGFSTCFRREAGAAGQDARDVPRAPVQQGRAVLFTRPEAVVGAARGPALERRSSCELLGLPYRVVVLPAGDMSSASAKTTTSRSGFPAQGRYRETSSISNTTDFQSRRLGIRLRGEGGPEPVHTAERHRVVDRIALAILENFQGDVPDVLQPFGAPPGSRPLASIRAPERASRIAGEIHPSGWSPRDGRSYSQGHAA